MKITKEGFPPIIDDNEVAYYNMLQSMVEAADSEALGHLQRTPDSVIIRITPSKNDLYSIILLVVKEINTIFGLVVEFSKSIKTSKNIVFRIKITP